MLELHSIISFLNRKMNVVAHVSKRNGDSKGGKRFQEEMQKMVNKVKKRKFPSTKQINSDIMKINLWGLL